MKKDSSHSIEDCSIKMFSQYVAAVKKQIGFRDITKRVGRYSGTMNNESFFLQRDWTPATLPPESYEAGWKNPEQCVWDSSKWGWSILNVWEDELLAVRWKDSQLWKAWRKLIRFSFLLGFMLQNNQNFILLKCSLLSVKEMGVCLSALPKRRC